MLTKEAFNALLKTLEEPPKHVIFILATTEQEKLPDTIVSRCLTFTFKKPTIEILKKMLLRVAKSEGYELEPSSAELVALLASGSFRDAHGYLQLVLSSTQGTKVSPEDVEAITGAPRSMQLLKLLDAVAEGDLDVSLQVVQELAATGADMKILLLLLLRMVRAVLLLRSAPSLKSGIQDEFTEEEFTSLGIHAASSKAKINSRLLVSLLDAQSRTGTTYTPQLPLEIALIEHLEVNE